MSDKKWSRDWSKMDWNEVERKLDEQMANPKKDGDIGITAEEFWEYLSWLEEEDMEEYLRITFFLKLYELGVSAKEAEYWFRNPQEFIDTLKKAAEEKETAAGEDAEE